MLYLNIPLILTFSKSIRLHVYLQTMYSTIAFPVSKMLRHLPNTKAFLHSSCVLGAESGGHQECYSSMTVKRYVRPLRSVSKIHLE